MSNDNNYHLLIENNQTKRILLPQVEDSSSESESEKKEQFVLEETEETSFTSVPSEEVHFNLTTRPSRKTQKNIIKFGKFAKNEPVTEELDLPSKHFGSESVKSLEEKKKSSFKRFLNLALTEKKLLFLAALFQIIQVSFQLLGPAYTGSIIHLVSSNHYDIKDKSIVIIWGCKLKYIIPNQYRCNSKKTILYIMIGEYIVSTIITCLFIALSSIYKRYASQNILATMRIKLFTSLINLDISVFDDMTTGALLNRLSQDVTKLGDFISYELTNRIGSVTIITGCIIYIIFISWELFLAMFTIFPLFAYISKKYGQYFKKKSKLSQDTYALASQVASETLTNIRTVKSFSTEDYHANKYSIKIHDAKVIGYKMAVSRGIFRCISIFLDNISMCIVLMLGGYLVLTDKLNVASFTTFILYTKTINNNFKQLIELYSSYNSAIGCSLRIFDIIEMKPKIKAKQGIILNKNDLNNIKIDFKNVSFSYPCRKNDIILDNFNLTLLPNTITALVGISGSGKSTITSLLMRHYDPNSGNIFIQNTNLKNINLKSFHSNIGIVSQEPILFAGTISENISYGVRNKILNFEDIKNAAVAANAHEFIAKFPNGYDTQVGERGIQLSGGQKQRIAIARALLIKPTLLILDEATSALDSESEYLVDKALKKLMKNKTVLIIAHRLSTIRNATNIVVLDNGQIIEQGSHNELIQDEYGFYSFLVKRQTKFRNSNTI